MERMTSRPRMTPPMKDEKLMRARLVSLRGELPNWGTPGVQASAVTKDELREWVKALEWVLGDPRRDTGQTSATIKLA